MLDAADLQSFADALAKTKPPALHTLNIARA
jgi:hypothetical protein